MQKVSRTLLNPKTVPISDVVDLQTALDGKATTTQGGKADSAIQPGDPRLLNAWGNFKGTSPLAVNKSYNVSSVTRVAQGVYDVNLATAMTDANYVVTVGVRGSPGHNTHEPEISLQTTTSFRIQTPSDGETAYGLSDWDMVSFMVKG